jgi:hypothetical protein
MELYTQHHSQNLTSLLRAINKGVDRQHNNDFMRTLLPSCCVHL